MHAVFEGANTVSNNMRSLQDACWHLDIASFIGMTNSRKDVDLLFDSLMN